MCTHLLVWIAPSDKFNPLKTAEKLRYGMPVDLEEFHPRRDGLIVWGFIRRNEQARIFDHHFQGKTPRRLPALHGVLVRIDTGMPAPDQG